jgi:aryl-alcohol dehydrogenase-like predicted oxidoreductase
MMDLRFANIGLAVLSIAIVSIISIDGFSLSSRPVASRFPAQHQLYSSLDNDDKRDDELSKLIEKRNLIKRSKEEQTKENDSLGDSSLAPDFDFDEMPDFETKRPARASSQKEEDKSKQRSRDKDESPIMDYLADYEDENEFHIPNRIGISTRSWGNEKDGFVPLGKLKKQELREGKFVPGDLQVAYDTLIKEGVVIFETSPVYGKAMASKKLSAEHILARCIKEHAETEISPLLVGTYCNKIWQRSPNALASAVSESCERMGMSGMEVIQVQNIGWLYPSGGLVKGMNEAVAEAGNANYAGVQNVSPLRMRRLVQKLDAYGLILTTNAFEFSLTNRKKEKWIQACKALGVIPLIQNPFDGGLASAQYTATNPSGGITGAAKYPFSKLEKLQPLHSVLETVAQRIATRVKRELGDVQDRNRGRYGKMVRIVE